MFIHLGLNHPPRLICGKFAILSLRSMFIYLSLKYSLRAVLIKIKGTKDRISQCFLGMKNIHLFWVAQNNVKIVLIRVRFYQLF